MKATFIALSVALSVAAEPISFLRAPTARDAATTDTSEASLFSQNTYDYIVVGGGTAGLVVAARLSEDGRSTVAVIEAGGSGLGVGMINTPGQFGADIGTVFDYNYTTVAGSGANAGVPSIGWPRGKVLGGSSALNFLVWDRASQVEYDAWEALGNKGWNWSNLYKYMKKAESFTCPSTSDQSLFRTNVTSNDYGSSGPVQVSFPRYVAENVQNWIPALKSLGVPANDNPLAGQNIGASVQPSDINPYNATRSYSAPAYLFPNTARRNLAVLTNAQVTKINFSSTKKNGNVVATGVTYTSGGKSYTVNARQEVIVSGGTVGTPAILELSGIGSSSVLSAARVKQIVNLPSVGENLQDHTYSCAAYELKSGHTTLDSLRNATFATQQSALYQSNKTSILDQAVPSIAYITLSQLFNSSITAKSIVADAAAFINKSNAPYKSTLQAQIALMQRYPDTIGQMEIIAVDGFFATSGAPVAGKNYLTFLAAQQHLLSRGTVHITSSNPSVYPKINPNYYSVPFDVSVATAGTAFLRKVAGTPQYANYIAQEAVPGSNVAGVNLTKYTTTTGFTTEYHPIGTASMLPRAQGGVVDATLTVYGTDNVRVVDASIIPVHISAHTQATVYGIAEMASDIIRGKF